MSHKHGGIISELVDGNWKHPETGKVVSIDIKSIVINESLDGMEGSLVRPLHENEKLAVISDQNTYEILGRRVNSSIRSEGLATEEIIWENPQSSLQGVEELRELTKDCDGLIAIGSGSINDSVKYAAHLDNKKYSVFPTSPQNAYTTPTASIYFDGFKKSITCHAAEGVFYDLSIISNCPLRLTQSAFADVICRTTSQVDWLLSHLLFNTPYLNTPYILLGYDEPALFDNISKLKERETSAYASLIRICALMGLGTNFTNTTHSGSMAEHMISHYIDMFAGAGHPGSLHGEQVGVATLTMSRLQNLVLKNEVPPRLSATKIDEKGIVARCGEKIGTDCIKQFKLKALDEKQANILNKKLDESWGQIATKLGKVMLEYDQLWSAMEQLGAPKTAEELGLSSEIYRDSVLYARTIRDRFTMLDLADDSGMLDAFSKEYL